MLSSVELNQIILQYGETTAKLFEHSNRETCFAEYVLKQELRAQNKNSTENERREGAGCLIKKKKRRGKKSKELQYEDAFRHD